MKLFKKLALAAMTLSLALSFGAFASCDDGNESSSSTEASVCYTFTVKNADGSAAQNVSVQLCTLLDDGSLGVCLFPVPVNAEGKCEYVNAEAGVYEIHLLDENSESVEFVESNKTPAEFCEITLTLK